jgi:hypothetical protein
MRKRNIKEGRNMCARKPVKRTEKKTKELKG